MSSHILATRSGNVELRGAPPTAEWGMSAPPPPGAQGVGHVAGVGISTESAVQIAAVYGAVGLLADSVSSLPLRALDRPTPQVATANELEPPQLLQEPFSEITLTDWLVQFIWALALRGNFYGQIIERDRFGDPTQIMPISPDTVMVRRIYQTGEIEYRFMGQKVANKDVFHVRYQMMPGMVVGLNPIQAMRYSFGTAHAQDIYQAEYFNNSANPSVVIEVPGDLNKDEVERLLRNWMAKHQGLSNSHLPSVVTGGAKVTPLTISPHDSQFLEQIKYSAEQIASLIFRVPPFMLGQMTASTSFGRGLEQQERTFVFTTLIGYLTRIESALSGILPKKTWANFDLTHRLRGDTEQRAKAGTLLRNAGIAHADDVRGWFDWPELPGDIGKKLIVNPQGEDLEAIEGLEEKQEREEGEAAAKTEAAKAHADALKAASNGKGEPQNVPVPTK